jgi:DNA-binding protein HU-beta
MSLLYIHYESDERASRVQKLARSGAHVIVSEPRWPGFWEIAKREKPIAVAVDFSQAPSHALETADYIAKAKETRDAAMYLLRVPEDRLDVVRKRLPQAAIVTESELAERLAVIEREAQKRAFEKKEAAAEARRTASAARQAAKRAAGGPLKPVAKAAKPVKKGKPPAPPKKKSAPSPKKTAAKKSVARKTGPSKKKSARPPRKK